MDGWTAYLRCSPRVFYCGDNTCRGDNTLIAIHKTSTPETASKGHSNRVYPFVINLLQADTNVDIRWTGGRDGQIFVFILW